MSAHILVVDDDTRLRALLKRYLREQGFAVSTAQNAQEARGMMQLFTPDAVVLDVMMPGETGLALAAAVKAGKDAPPILMLSALTGTEDRIQGLEAGVDDYLPKPFEPRELVLRLQAVLRRHTKPSARSVAFGEFRFDLEANQLLRAGEALHLTGAESALLKILAERSGEAVSREELMRLAGIGTERGVDVQITRLRKKIEPAEGRPVYIQTVRGAGYGLFGVT